MSFDEDQTRAADLAESDGLEEIDAIARDLRRHMSGVDAAVADVADADVQDSLTAFLAEHAVCADVVIAARWSADGIRRDAHAAAEQLLEDARRVATGVVASAVDDAERIASEAQRLADSVVAAAAHEAERVRAAELDRANLDAERIVVEARAKALRIIGTAESLEDRSRLG